MTWVRIADDFADHPKIARAGPLATFLWICSLAYANKHLTDGFIPTAAVRRLADVDDPARLALTLVDVGLWETADGGYRIHDFGEYQPTAQTVREEREENRKRMAAWRERRKSERGNSVTDGVTNRVTDDVTNSRVTLSPAPAVNPAVNPDPAGTLSPLPPPPQAGKGGRSKRTGDAAVAVGQDAATAATSADRALWKRAMAEIATLGLTPGNVELIGRLSPVGRGTDGGLTLQAPLGSQDVQRFQHIIARALLDAGDHDGPNVRVAIEGSIPAPSPPPDGGIPSP